MDFKRGDKVRFLNEQGGGVVVKVTDNVVYVQIEDGFEIPVLNNQVVKVESASETKSVKTESSKPEKPAPRPSVSVKVETEKEIQNNSGVNPLFAILPFSGSLTAEHARFDLYLLNDSAYYLSFVTSFESDGKCKVVEQGELEPEMSVKIGNFFYDELLKPEAIRVDLLFYHKKTYAYQPPVNYRINLKTLNLLKISQYVENDYFDDNALLISLIPSKLEDLTKKFMKEEKPVSKQEKVVKPSSQDIEEIDLHIEEIVENPGNMSPGEILDTQMARFTTALDGAIRGKTKKIVFIHGVGNGKLRYELRKALENKYSDLQYQDASFAEYGYGATMVIIRK